jgi:uncharacterized protein with PIN domain
VQIGFDGLLPRKDYSRLSSSSDPWPALKVDASLGRVCGKLRLLRGAAFFAWSATLGKIFTVDNLRKMYIIIVDRCCLCKRDEESVDHLLLHFALWNTLFK